MIADLKPYSEYKASGLPWLDAVPNHWDMVPNRALMQNQRQVAGEKVADYTLLSLTLRGIIPRNMDNPKGKFPARFNTYKVVKPEDLVFCLFDIDETPRAVGHSKLAGMITGAYDVFRPCRCINPRFLYHYYLFVDEGKLLKPFYTGLRKTIQRGIFASIKAPCPPLDEQAAIVRFIDYATRRIDRTIKAKRKMIALLNEQKQAIIHRAVTRGLDPNVSLKSSVIPWLGDIPEHWETRRVKQISRIVRGKFSHRPRNDQSLYDGMYPFIQTGAVAKAKKFITSYTQTLNEKGLAVSKIFAKGTLVMTIAANIGDVAILTFDACFPDSIVGFVPFKEINQDYLYLVFLCMKPELLREAPVNTQGNLNVERIGAMGMPLPPIDEQSDIVHYIEDKIAPLSAAISRTELAISLLREYRTRLIADVVTGKLDVREAAKKLPDETVESGIIDDDEILVGDEEMEESLNATGGGDE